MRSQGVRFTNPKHRGILDDDELQYVVIHCYFDSPELTTYEHSLDLTRTTSLH